MSFITPATVQSIANSLDITRISDDAAKALAPDVEYRLREVIQEALKCMRHSRRTVLTAHDVAQALRIQNIEVVTHCTISLACTMVTLPAQPLYGWSSTDALRFRRVAGHGDLYCVANRVLTVDQVLQGGLPPPPRDVALTPHWLAVDGTQPKIPQNQPLLTNSGAVAPIDRKRPREPSTMLPERPSKVIPATGRRLARSYSVPLFFVSTPRRDVNHMPDIPIPMLLHHHMVIARCPCCSWRNPQAASAPCCH